MSLVRWMTRATSTQAGAAVTQLLVEPQEWRELAQDVAAAGGRLLALWGTNRVGQCDTLHAVTVAPPRVLAVTIPLDADGGYPGVEDVFPSASRMQRAVFDLCGVRSTGQDTRPWLRHAAWPEDAFPLVANPMPAPPQSPLDDYAFVRVEGDGVHEIAVGPVHAGIIEPGHFRFSVVGEKVLRLEERLGYVHKGIERRFTELPILDGHRLAARVSGDSAVAYAWSYCQALERMAGTVLPPRAAWLRALALELERIANHLGDLGALGNDAGFAVGLAQFSRLKEHLLRATEQALGQRYLLDFVVPGGTRNDFAPAGATVLDEYLVQLTDEVTALRGIYEEHTGLRDRFAGAGTVLPELAAWIGLVGLAGRASGQLLDLRVDAACAPYAELNLRRCTRQDGDVLARVTLRFDELSESVRIVRRILRALPSGNHSIAVTVPLAGAVGVGLIEAWRGLATKRMPSDSML